MGVFTNIEIALNTRLATVATGTPPAIRIAWPNTKFEPVENQNYLRPVLLPAQTVLDTLSGMEVHKGIYQVDVYVPLEKGVVTLNTWLDTVASAFRSSKVITATDAVIVQSVSRGRAQRQDAYYNSFVEVNYLCYK